MVHGQQAGKIKSLLILSINRVKYKRLKKKKTGQGIYYPESETNESKN